jgi:hypothetical protein
MRRRHTASLTVLLAAGALAVPSAPASAKGLTGVSVCGAHGCVDRGAQLGGAAARSALLDYGDSVADPGRAPFLRLKEWLGDGGKKTGRPSTVIFIPSSGLRRFDDGTWRRAAPEVLEQLRRITRGVAPLPAARLAPFRPAPGPPIPEAPPWSRPPTGHDTSATPWLAGGAGALLAVLAAGVTAVRRTRRGRPGGTPALG